MYNKILITLVTAMLPSAAMCAKSPKEEEEQPQKQEKKKAIARRLIENKSKPKGDDEKEETERRNEEEEQPQKQEARKAAADERSRITKNLFIGPNMLRLKKFQKLHQDLQQALNELSSGKTFEEMRKKGLSVFPDNDQIDALKVRLRQRLEEAFGEYTQEAKSLFPDRSAVRALQDANLALESPAWNTPEEKAEAEEIDKLKINPLDLMEGKIFYSTNLEFPLLHYYTEMTEEKRQYFRKDAMIHGRTSDNMGIIEID